MTWSVNVFVVLQICITMFLSGCSASANDAPQDIVGSVINMVYWSDGDSGRLDGVKFRLANVDAPETGSLKQRGGAKCESEREIGYQSKAFLVALGESGTVQVERSYGYDSYQRLVVDLSVNGQDIGKAAVAAGHLKAWPHRKGRAQAHEPDWYAQ